MSLRQMPVAQQRERAAMLDEIRLERRLTGEEQSESDSLADALYMREYRARRVEQFGSADAKRRPRNKPLTAGAAI